MSKDIHKWTNGRYTLMFDEHTFFVWDNEKEKRMTALQVTKKLNEQQATIDILLEELVNAQQQGYVVNFLHKNEHCSLIPKELEDE